ncbi:MAG: P-type conjugative transfer protein VirB9 [Sedimentibacter sp.]
MKKTYLAIVAALLMTGNISTYAKILPTPISVKDSRIQEVNYDANDVVVIRTEIGKAVLIQFEDDELIEGNNTGLGIGDAEAWNLSVRGNHVFLKPKAPMPDTNMIIVTNKRQYAFSLTTSKKVNNLGYIVRFKYPDSERKKQLILDDKRAEINAKLALADSLKAENKKLINLNYFKRGDLQISPTKIWDNNQFTFFKFSNAKAMPAIYKLNEDGTEALVNTHVQDDTLIVHETNKDFYLRLGNSVLHIKNAKYDDNGIFNIYGTSDDSKIRLENDVAE